MIKLERNFHPLCLDPERSRQLTDDFKATKSSVWNFDELKNALLDTSHGKCAYCECNLRKESKYMEVEHFRDKDSHPDDVVKWSNLLPSCKRCNGSKGSHDVDKEPIVNPYEVDPRDHFTFKLYRLRPKTPIGQESIGVLDLNNSNRAVQVRFEIGEKIQESLASILDILSKYKINSATRTKNRLLGSLKGLLKECQPFSDYAATSASVVHSDASYHSIVEELKRLGLWDEELNVLDVCSRMVVLDAG